MNQRFVLLLISSVVTALLVLLPSLAAAQADGLSVLVRDTTVHPDGSTELIVNVTGSAKPSVLDASAFEVSEQGEVVENLAVEPLLDEVDKIEILVGLVIDVSGSMRGEPMELTKEAAAAVVTDLTDKGIEVQLFSFASDVETLTPPTTDAAELVGAIGDLEARGETALYDAVVVAARELARSEAQVNLVVFSDGGDTASTATLEDGIAAANLIEVPVTIVALDTPELDPAAIEELAGGTGGRAITADDSAQIQTAFDEAVSDIASQYLLRYRSELIEPDNLNLTVAVSAGDIRRELSYTVPNLREGAPPAPPRPTVIAAPEAGPLDGSNALIVGAGAAFLAVLLLAGLMFTGSKTRAERVLSDQLARYIEGSDPRAGRSGDIAAHFRDRAMALVESTPRPKGLDANLTVRLEQAAWPLRNGEFLLLSLLSGLAALALVSLVFNPLGGILVGLMAGTIPYVILENRRSKRQNQFLGTLPDTLGLMAGALRAGYGVLQALDTVAKESTGPTSEEFTRVLTEARLGMPVETAMEDMANRIDNDDLRWVVMAINIQREVGGNLAELLDTVAAVLREREMLRRQIKVLSAEGRLSAIVLILLPIFLVTYLILVRPEYVSTLVTSGALGWIMVIGGSVLMLGGVVWIRNLVRIEV
jgi:tight adherence protein B